MRHKLPFPRSMTRLIGIPVSLAPRASCLSGQGLFKNGTKFHSIFKIAGTVYIAGSSLGTRLSGQFELGWRMFQHIKVVSMATAMLAVLSTLASISTASAAIDEDSRTSWNTNAIEHVSIYSAQARFAAAASLRSIGIGY